MESHNLVSLSGIFILLIFAWLFSANRRVINWRIILWGIGLQMLFALFVFIIPVGTKVFLLINDLVVKVLDSASAGTRFVFGRLALPPGEVNEQGETSLGFFLAFQVFPAVVFFSTLMAALYYVKIMPVLIRGFGMTRSELCTILTACMATIASSVMAMYVFMVKNEFPTIAGHLVSASVLSAPAALVMSKILMPETEVPSFSNSSVEK